MEVGDCSHGTDPSEIARLKLDAFREAVQPESEYAITLSETTLREAKPVVMDRLVDMAKVRLASVPVGAEESKFAEAIKPAMMEARAESLGA